MSRAFAEKKLLWMPWVICGLAALFYCYEYFLRITPSVMTNELMRAYHLTAGEIGGLSAFYYHAYVPMQIMVGLCMDRYGPRYLLTLACLFCAVGTYLFASSHYLAVAEFGRFLVGFGSAFAFVGAMKVATIWLPPNRFTLIAGIILCLGMLGAMFGDIVLGAMVHAVGWRVALFIAAAIGVLLSLIIWLVVRDKNPLNTHHETYNTDFQSILRGLWQALQNPQIWLNGIVGLLLYLSLSAFAELWGVRYLEEAHGLTSGHAATANSMIFLGWAIGGPLWGIVSDQIGRRRLPMLCASIGAFILICLLLYLPGLSFIQICACSLLLGIASSVQILIFAICREMSHIRIAGTAIALTNMLVMLGGNLFQPVIGRILDFCWMGTMVDGARTYSVHAFQIALGVLPVSILLAIVIMMFVRETYCKIKTD